MKSLITALLFGLLLTNCVQAGTIFTVPSPYGGDVMLTDEPCRVLGDFGNVQRAISPAPNGGTFEGCWTVKEGDQDNVHVLWTHLDGRRLSEVKTPKIKAYPASELVITPYGRSVAKRLP